LLSLSLYFLRRIRDYDVNGQRSTSPRSQNNGTRYFGAMKLRYIEVAIGEFR
jgi:hypothetical protein